MEQGTNQVAEVRKKVRKVKVKKAKAKIFTHRIKEVMSELDMCDKELADLIESNAPHVYRILKSERPCLSLPIALKISRALKRPIEDLFFLTKEDFLKFKTKKLTNK